MGHFRPKNFFMLITLDLLYFFAIWNNERGQEVHGNYINRFFEKKNYMGQVGHFGPLLGFF